MFVIKHIHEREGSNFGRSDVNRANRYDNFSLERYYNSGCNFLK